MKLVGVGSLGKRAKKPEFLEHFHNLYSDFKGRILNRAESVTLFLEDFINVFKQAGNCMKIRNNNHVTSNVKEQPPWWDHECQLDKVGKYSLLKKFRAINSQVNFNKYKTAKSHFKKITRRKRLQFQKRKRSELIKSSDNPKEYWKNIKRDFNKKSSNNSINGDAWLNYFKNLLNINVPDVHEQVLNNITQNNDCGYLDRQITDDEIIASVKSIHSSRSPGPDGICIEMIKSTLNELVGWLFWV